MAARKRPRFFDLVDEAKSHLCSLMLWPKRWRAHTSPKSLPWKTLTFTDKSQPNVPNKPGVYAFLVKPSIANLDVSYLMYIGKTDRSLRKRFGEYRASIRQYKGRPAVVVFLHKYDGFLHFCCAPVESPRSPSKVEERLLAAFIPPANKQLPARARRIMAAFS